MMARARVRRRAPRRAAALAAVIAALKRRYGEHIIRLGAESLTLTQQAAWPPLSTGALGLDLLTGGLPRGHMTEYTGREGAGVETLAASAVATCQQSNGLALLIDADGAVDPDALLAAGVDLARLIIAVPATAREGWAVLATLTRCGALDLLVLAALPGLLALPRDGWRGERGVGVGYLARRLGRVAWALRGRPTALLLLNRVVDYPYAAAAALSRSIGEEAVAPVAALRVALTPERVEHTPDGDIAALRAYAAVRKHHGAPRGPHLPLTITPSGPCRASELITLGQMAGCLELTSLGLALDGVVLGRSTARAIATLRGEPDLADRLEQRIKERWGIALMSTPPGAAR